MGTTTAYRTRQRLLAAAAACLGILCNPAMSASPPAASDLATSARTKAIAFEPNRGQSDDAVRFIARGGDYTVFLTATEVVFSPRSPNAQAVRMTLVGANRSPATIAANALPGKVNYVPGSGPQARLTDIPTYGKVRYAGVYPGVDLVFYDNQGTLEYDFVVAPGADPDVIALAFDGVRAIAIDDRDGALVLHTQDGQLRHSAPLVYQEDARERTRVAGKWVFTGAHEVGVRMSPYDRARPLVIDPLISYSSYLGGRGDDLGWDVALDAGGNVYVTGATTSPTFPGATPRGTTSSAAFVTKLNAAGQLLYSTFLLDTDERGATGIAVDSAGNAYVTGQTSLYRATGSNDVFVAKLDAFGRTLRPAGYFVTFGGSRIDTGQRIAVDGSGNAFVAGVTASGNFPITSGAFRRVPAGGRDAFVTKINAAGTSIAYSTLLGGSGDDSANDIALDALGNAYVAGSTESIDFPVTAAAWQRSHRGCDAYGNCAKTAFVTKVNAWGSGLVYSTYLGGSGVAQETYAEGIAVDGAGQAYVTGATSADNFPTTAGVVQPNAGYPLCFYRQCTDAFVTKLNASGSGLVYSTYLMGETLDAGNGIAVDTAGNAYVAGSTASRFFPIVDAFQPIGGSHENGFVTKLNANATRIVWSSYLGGVGTAQNFAGASVATAIAVDALGRAHVTGETYATNFPTSTGAAQRFFGGCTSTLYACSDGFVTRIAASGPGVAQATTIRMTSTRAVIGGTISATWSGIANPSDWDTIHLFPLGSSDEPWEVWGGWYATGAATGTVQIPLPPGLEAGWYELRYSAFNDLYGPAARSSPFQVVAF
jgi:hypothetical protein